jgi:hypothetical protein
LEMLRKLRLMERYMAASWRRGQKSSTQAKVEAEESKDQWAPWDHPVPLALLERMVKMERMA